MPWCMGAMPVGNKRQPLCSGDLLLNRQDSFLMAQFSVFLTLLLVCSGSVRASVRRAKY